MKPNVELLGSLDERGPAWAASRPNISEHDMGSICKMDLSINSMAMYTYKITSSLLFRDFMLGLRPIHPWARSSRAVPMTRANLQISGELFSDKDDLILDDIIEMLKDGMPQDTARENLPMSLSTVFCVTIDHRTMVGFLKTMFNIDKDLFDCYGKLFIDATPGLEYFWESKTPDFLDAYIITDDERDMNLKTVGEMTAGCYNMKAALAAQFLRQHNSKIKTSFWTKIAKEGYFNISMQQFNPVEVVFYSDRNTYRKTMQARSHWLADWASDMWGNIVSDYVKDMTLDDFWAFIPNGAGKEDPYKADMMARVNHEDPNLPCPIMCEWPDLVRQRIEQFGDNDVIRLYLALCNYGYIKDNIDNKYRQQYLEKAK